MSTYRVKRGHVPLVNQLELLYGKGWLRIGETAQALDNYNPTSKFEKPFQRIPLYVSEASLDYDYSKLARLSLDSWGEFPVAFQGLAEIDGVLANTNGFYYRSGLYLGVVEIEIVKANGASSSHEPSVTI